MFVLIWKIRSESVQLQNQRKHRLRQLQRFFKMCSQIQVFLFLACHFSSQLSKFSEIFRNNKIREYKITAPNRDHSGYVHEPHKCQVHLQNQLLQLCMARTVYSDVIIRPVSVRSGKCTTQMVIQSANLVVLTKDTVVI